MTVEVKACSILSKRTNNTAVVPVSTTIERGTKTKSHSAQTEDSTLLDSLKAMERKRVNNFADSLFKSDTNFTCKESKTLRLFPTKTKLNSKAVLIFNLIFENYGWYFQRIQLHVSTVIIHHSPDFPFGFVIQTSVQEETKNHICINHNCVLLRTLGFQASKKAFDLNVMMFQCDGRKGLNGTAK